MLTSQDLKQQNEEAAKIVQEAALQGAREGARAQRSREESKASKAAKTELPSGRTPDLTGGVELEALRFPANVMMANSSSALAVGNRYDNSMNISGTVKRLVQMPGGYVYGLVESQTGARWVVVMPSGMTGELAL